MQKRSTTSLAVGLAMVACMGGAVAGCGQKGPLTLPAASKPAATTASAIAAAASTSATSGPSASAPGAR